MQYTVTINDKTVTVNLNGYKGVAKCCATDTFNLQTGIELALERARVAEANANKPTAKPTIAEAIKIVEEYVGDHIAIVGRGASLSENQKRELRKYADMYAPSHSCKCEDRYYEGYADGYEEGYADGSCECDCECHCNEADEVSAMAKRMIARIEEILGD